MSLTEYREPAPFSEHDSAERRFLQLISALPKASVQGYDKERNVIYWNKSSEDIYGSSECEAIGRKLEALAIPDFMKQDGIILHPPLIEFGEAIPSE